MIPKWKVNKMCTVKILFLGLYFISFVITAFILEIKSRTKRKQWKGDCQVETKSLSVLNVRWDNRSQGSTITHISNLSQNKEINFCVVDRERRKDLEKSKQKLMQVYCNVPIILYGLATLSITVSCCNSVVTHSMELQSLLLARSICYNPSQFASIIYCPATYIHFRHTPTLHIIDNKSTSTLKFLLLKFV